jgi:hypothetical protein
MASMQRQATAVGLMLAFVVSAPVWADIYRWQDARGVMHFSNEPPPAGVTVIEKMEETPYDAEADRRRLEEERRLRLERRQEELEERKAGLSAREQEAQMRLEEADRRLNEAEQIRQRSQEAAREEGCDDDYYFRYGNCGDLPYGRRYYEGRPGSPDLYRGYYRENNNLYYKDHRRPGYPPGPPPVRPGLKPAPRTDGPPGGAKGKKPPPAWEDPGFKKNLAPQVPAAPK